MSATSGGCGATAGVQRYATLVDGVAAANSADTFDAVVFLQGILDIRAGVAAVSARNALRAMLVQTRDRQIVPVMTRLDDGTNLVSAGSLADLNTQIWQLTEENLGLEIYRQALFGIASGGAYPTQAGYDRMAALVLEKVAREFPLQPCDARNDKPGKGCPRNP